MQNEDWHHLGLLEERLRALKNQSGSTPPPPAPIEFDRNKGHEIVLAIIVSMGLAGFGFGFWTLAGAVEDLQGTKYAEELAEIQREVRLLVLALEERAAAPADPGNGPGPRVR